MTSDNSIISVSVKTIKEQTESAYNAGFMFCAASIIMSLREAGIGKDDISMFAPASMLQKLWPDFDDDVKADAIKILGDLVDAETGELK